MLFLFTDFGLRSSYVGQMHAVLSRAAPDICRIDLNHAAPAFDPMRAGHLLASERRGFEPGDVILGVVDPGVGTERSPIAVQADDVWYVGPDNGLFAVVWDRAAHKQAFRIDWRPAGLSASFHGRDLFAPIAARLARAEPGSEPSVRRKDLALLDRPPLAPGKSGDLAEIVFVDDYGNAVSGLRAEAVAPTVSIEANGQIFQAASTFADDRDRSGFWYINSNGLVEISVGRGSAARQFELKVGTKLSVVAPADR